MNDVSTVYCRQLVPDKSKISLRLPYIILTFSLIKSYVKLLSG